MVAQARSGGAATRIAMRPLDAAIDGGRVPRTRVQQQSPPHAAGDGRTRPGGAAGPPRGAVESMPGLTVIQVNVHVQGVDVGGHGRGSAKAEGAGG